MVCDDADLDLAAEHAVASAFIDAGQRCGGGSRIIVLDAFYDAFSQKMLARRKPSASDRDPRDDCGPVISSADR